MTSQRIDDLDYYIWDSGTTPGTTLTTPDRIPR